MGLLDVAHKHLDGRTYKLVGPDYKGGTETNCSIATWQIVEALYEIKLTREEQRDWMIVDPARPWSPMDAVVSAGVGMVVDKPIPGRWHLLQTWRRLDPLDRGHSTLYYEAPAMLIDGCLVVQATYDMSRAFLPVENFFEATKGYRWRLAALNQR